MPSLKCMCVFHLSKVHTQVFQEIIMTFFVWNKVIYTLNLKSLRIISDPDIVLYSVFWFSWITLPSTRVPVHQVRLSEEGGHQDGPPGVLRGRQEAQTHPQDVQPAGLHAASVSLRDLITTEPQSIKIKRKQVCMSWIWIRLSAGVCVFVCVCVLECSLRFMGTLSFGAVEV